MKFIKNFEYFPVGWKSEKKINHMEDMQDFS